LPLPDKPSLVVLPFTNISGDPTQDYFSDGITEDLTTALAKVSSLFVIARNSAFVYKGKPVDVKAVSRELGVRYVLEGSVQRADNRVRITAQLVDGPSAAHVWAESYDRDLKDIFAVQDEVRQEIVLALRVKLTAEEQERFRRAPTDNLEAYDYFLRGSEYYLHYGKETNTQARQMFEKAIELDPEYAGAYMGLGSTYFVEGWSQWSRDPQQSIAQAFKLAQRAITLNDSLSPAHILLGDIHLLKKQHEQAIAELEKAITLDPNNAFGYADLGHTLIWAGRPEEAIGLIKKAMRLDPHYPVPFLDFLGFAYRLTGQYGEAVPTLKRVLARNPDYWGSRIGLTIIYSDLGQQEEARAEAAEILRTNPNFSLELWGQLAPYKDPAQLERDLAALRKAGLK